MKTFTLTFSKGLLSYCLLVNTLSFYALLYDLEQKTEFFIVYFGLYFLFFSFFIPNTIAGYFLGVTTSFKSSFFSLVVLYAPALVFAYALASLVIVGYEDYTGSRAYKTGGPVRLVSFWTCMVLTPLVIQIGLQVTSRSWADVRNFAGLVWWRWFLFWISILVPTFFAALAVATFTRY